ncbi:MAG: hypothetical protein JKY27_12230 [Magnetovibrio sp.]|nr:hypothetical protein [Magnetovibrio sp.]
MYHKHSQGFEDDLITRLMKHPTSEIQGSLRAYQFSARLAITNLRHKLVDFFSAIPEAHTSAFDNPFQHFGLIIEFSGEASLEVFDDAFHLNPTMKTLISTFGAVSVRNIRLRHPRDEDYQKNIFPQLVFHVDRGAQFDNQYSLFYRNPDDPDHQPPRDTSTLILPNIATFLKAREQGTSFASAALSHQLFDERNITNVIGEYMLEQKWDAPRGTGEICMFDNRTVMHASYHREQRGYPIAVQYLY